MGLTRAEQETIIRWDEDEQVIHLYSASPKTWRKLTRLGLTPVKETTMQGVVTGRFYRVPVAGFRWGLKRALAARPGNADALQKAREARQVLIQRRNAGPGSMKSGQNTPGEPGTVKTQSDDPGAA